MDPFEPFIEGCTGKLRYSTKSTAKLIIRRWKARGLDHKVSAYRCENCDGFHLTSHRKSKEAS
jgi:hypothetical protein